jgi:hypothetical protein
MNCKENANFSDLAVCLHAEEIRALELEFMQDKNAPALILEPNRLQVEGELQNRVQSSQLSASRTKKVQAD